MTFETIRNGRLCGSIPDITKALGSLQAHIKNWKVDLNVCPSSHDNAKESYTTAEPSAWKYNTQKADWETFTEICKASFCKLEKLKLNDEAAIKLAVKTMNTIIDKACSAAIAKKSQSNRKTNPWWTKELEELKKAVIYPHHKIITLKKARMDVTHKKVKQEYAKAIRKASTENFKKLWSAQGKEIVWSVTNRIIKEANVRYPPTTIRINGEFTKSKIETDRAFLDALFPDDSFQKFKVWCMENWGLR